MIGGIIVFIIGFWIYTFNRMLKCSAYWIGYSGVVIQGIGIGIILCEIFPEILKWSYLNDIDFQKLIAYTNVFK